MSQEDEVKISKIIIEYPDKTIKEARIEISIDQVLNLSQKLENLENLEEWKEC